MTTLTTLESRYYPQLAERVRSQAELQPGLYGDFPFDQLPHRFTTDPDGHSSLPKWVGDREKYLADDRLIELARITTFLGDVVADPYAALAAEYGLKGLVSMLQRACREGVDAVPDAPPELVAFIKAMEATPDWLDMELVEEGARAARIPAAFLSPYLLRGAFLGTFTNTYAALPMTLTGALSSRRAAHRVLETASFFNGTTMPGSLERFGPGFEAAAMVRLMHSMVRFNALKRSDKWDLDVFGFPVPQIDQMPAGLLNIYVIASGALRRGRTHFTTREQAILEHARYRCFLLGLPEELLPTTPQGVVDIFHVRGATLRGDFDDEICGSLVRSTMEAYIQPGDSLLDRVNDVIEKSWSKVSFAQAFVRGNREAAARMSVHFGLLDQLVVAATAPLVLGRTFGLIHASQIDLLREPIDWYATWTLGKQLKSYGVPQFVTDHRHYPAA